MSAVSLTRERTLHITCLSLGVGLPDNNATITPLYGWAADYDLDSYPGTVHKDGVAAAVDIVSSSPEVVTLLAIAPATNFPAMISQGGSAFVANARVVAMSGSIRRGCASRLC